MREVVETEQFDGYEVRKEKVTGQYGLADGEAMYIPSAFTPKGEYIGDPETARQLIERGIKPELAATANHVCAIGFCEREQKWYGWSHKAMAGFGIGDMLFDEDDYAAGDDSPMKDAPVIATLDEARQAAVNFAEYVS